MTLEAPRADAPAGPGRLVEAARAGDSDAFAELYRRFAASVHAILLSRLDPEEARELTQDVFLKAHRKLASLREPESFGPWLHAIARRLAASRLRSRIARPRPESLRDVPARPADDAELRERVLAAIRSLPEAYRETLAMRLIEGMTGPEIARATGLSTASVRVNLHRGMDLLRALLKREGWP